MRASKQKRIWRAGMDLYRFWREYEKITDMLALFLYGSENVKGESRFEKLYMETMDLECLKRYLEFGLGRRLVMLSDRYDWDDNRLTKLFHERSQ